MRHRASAAHVPTAAGAGIAITGVTKTFVSPGGVNVAALRGIDVHAAAGSVTALLGASGSGKSTLLHLLGGMDHPDEGSILVGETDVARLSRRDLVRYRRTVGFVFQHFALLPALTARDNVMLPLVPYRTSFDQRERAEQLLDSVGLGDRPDALPSQLSGGQRQRVAIARALIGGPRLLVADEPTGNLDSATGAEVVSLLLKLREERGVTVVVATHDEALAERCDQRVRIADGRRIGEPEHDAAP
ncbi:MAG: transporter [Nocardioides sp.]|nr:transporter [Nocardioides sp.]